MSSSKYINEDTYQTLQEVNIETQSDYEKAIEPLWKENPNQYKDIELFNDQWRTAGAGTQKVATHFGQGMIDCMTKKVQKK